MFFVINWKWMAIFWHIVETYHEFSWGCFVARSAATLFKLDYHFYWGYFISVGIPLTAISICTKNANRIVNSASTITSSWWYVFSHYATSCTQPSGILVSRKYIRRLHLIYILRLFPFWFRMVFFFFLASRSDCIYSISVSLYAFGSVVVNSDKPNGDN